MPRSLVVLLPGLLCDHRVFAGSVRRLQSLRPAQQVIVPRVDLHASITAAAEAVLGEVAAAAAAAKSSSTTPLSVAVAGFSFGGYIALEMARLLLQQKGPAAPRPPFSLDRLALLSSQAREDTPAHTERRTAQIALARREGKLDAVLAQQARVLFHPSFLPPDGDLDRLVAQETSSSSSAPQPPHPFATFVRMGADTGVDGFEREQRAIMSRVDTRDALASFCRGAGTGASAPRSRRRVLVLAGRDDRLLPPMVHMDLKALCEEAAAAAAAQTDVRLVLLSDCGHMSPLEKPDEVGDALAEWLA